MHFLTHWRSMKRYTTLAQDQKGFSLDIDPDLIKHLKIEEGAFLEMSIKEGALHITPVDKEKIIQEKLDRFKESYGHALERLAKEW